MQSSVNEVFFALLERQLVHFVQGLMGTLFCIALLVGVIEAARRARQARNSG